MVLYYILVFLLFQAILKNDILRSPTDFQRSHLLYERKQAHAINCPGAVKLTVLRKAKQCWSVLLKWVNGIEGLKLSLSATFHVHDVGHICYWTQKSTRPLDFLKSRISLEKYCVASFQYKVRGSCWIFQLVWLKEMCGNHKTYLIRVYVGNLAWCLNGTGIWRALWSWCIHFYWYTRISLSFYHLQSLICEFQRNCSQTFSTCMVYYDDT